MRGNGLKPLYREFLSAFFRVKRADFFVGGIS